MRRERKEEEEEIRKCGLSYVPSRLINTKEREETSGAKRLKHQNGSNSKWQRRDMSFTRRFSNYLLVTLLYLDKKFDIY